MSIFLKVGVLMQPEFFWQFSLKMGKQNIALIYRLYWEF